MKLNDNLQIKSFADYKKAYKESVGSPEKFWEAIAEKFEWREKWKNTLEWDFEKPEIKWFQGGKLNITEKLLGSSPEKPSQ